MAAYYNEWEAYPAQWLRNLIERGLIAPGDVDERSITDVRPDDLRGYDQCHFFAGIGGWSYALRLAGWADDRFVWSGSCPCQPFSAAGKQRGSDDERHLWPAFFDIIRECRPATVFGEQVAGAAGLAWLDHVCADLEGAGYAAAAADLPACGVGAPHRRQRLFWVADDNTAGRCLERRGRVFDRERQAQRYDADGRGEDGRLADAAPRGFGIDGSASRSSGYAAFGDATGGMGYSERAGLEGHRADQAEGGRNGDGRPVAEASPWRDLEWLPCSDGKARPTQPGLFPLAHGVSSRVGRLRAYGNAIVPQVAAEFIAAVMGCRP